MDGVVITMVARQRKFHGAEKPIAAYVNTRRRTEYRNRLRWDLRAVMDSTGQSQTIRYRAARIRRKVILRFWLGIRPKPRPVNHELIYANSRTFGLCLCSMRNENLSRYYVQAPVG